MPYRRRRTRFRRKASMGIRKRRYKRFVRRVKHIANTAGEKKYFAVSSGGPQTVDDSGVITSISNIQQGDTDVSRDGDQAYIRSLEVHWEANAADVFNVLRFMVVQWYPATTPTVSDILLTTGTDGFMSPYNHDQRFQFRVLYDKRVTVDTDRPSIAFRTRLRRFGRRRIQYLGGTTDGQNKLYVLKISDSSAASHPLIQNFTKLNFSDN